MSKSMKKVLGHEAGISNMVHKADWLVERENRVRTGKKEARIGKATRKIPQEVLLAAVKEKQGGATVEYLASKFQVSKGYILAACNRLYVTNKMGRELLKSIVLENGIAAGMRAKETIGDLTPMQSVMATGLMAKTFIELDKHNASQPAEVDFAELQKIGENLDAITKAIGETDDGDGEDFIDV